jgi:hypothetical protein
MNSFAWTYPVFAVRHGGGLASVRLEPIDGEDRFALAVFTTSQHCQRFFALTGIEGESARLNNDHEFAMLASALKRPHTDVAFDCEPIGSNVNAKWSVSIDDLLKDHLPWSRSPWNYPVFVLRQGKGYASIEADSSDGSPIHALAMFTVEKLAEDYREGAKEAGDVDAIDTPRMLSVLLERLTEASAVAINPTADDGVRTANICVTVQTLLEKYLQ